VTWTASSGATSYKVYRATTSTGTQLYRGVSTGTYYDDRTASPGVTYYYWVEAYRSTIYIGITTYNTGWRKLLQPTELQATDATYSNKVRVTWIKSTGATSYKVYRATSATGTQLYLGDSTGSYFDDRTASPGITYYYWVVSCRGTSFSGYDTYDTGWRNLLPPTGVQASDGTHTDKVQVTWNASTGATSYKVYRATSATGTQLYRGVSTGTSYDDTTASPGVTYYYWVVAYRSTRYSATSNYNTGWRNILPPVNMQATDGTYTNKVRVTWTASSGATTYKVYRADTETGEKVYLGASTGTYYDDRTATPGVTYYYWVVACNGTKHNGYSTSDTGWRQ